MQESTPLKHNLLKLAVGLGAGYFSRKMVVGKSAGIVKKALGTALQFGITQFVAKKDPGNNTRSNSHPVKEKKPSEKNTFNLITLLKPHTYFPCFSSKFQFIISSIANSA